MPCSSEYLEPNQRERESVRVLEFLREIRGQEFDHDEPHTDVYGVYGNPLTLDKDTAELCAWLRKITSQDVKLYSLELQLWWQRHQKADKKRAEREKLQRRLAAVKEAAKKKLTDEERRALGL